MAELNFELLLEIALSHSRCVYAVLYFFSRCHERRTSKIEPLPNIKNDKTPPFFLLPPSLSSFFIPSPFIFDFFGSDRRFCKYWLSDIFLPSWYEAPQLNLRRKIPARATRSGVFCQYLFFPPPGFFC